MTIIEQIKDEIERLKTVQLKRIQEGDLVDAEPYDKNEAYNELLDFIGTLEKSEKPINPEAAMKELDEKIALVKQRGTWDGVDVDKYMDEVRGRDPEKPVPNDLEGAAIDFADNARKRLFAKDYAISSIADYDHGCIDGFIDGAKWQKEQMMQEAVEGEITKDNRGNNVVRAGVFNKDFEYGDKVHLVIIKEG